MKKGFTLLEMIVVVLIIAALFILTIPNVQKVIGVVHETSCDAQLKIVDTAIVEYYLLNNSEPTSVQVLVSSGLLTEKQISCQNGKSIGISNGQAVLQ